MHIQNRPERERPPAAVPRRVRGVAVADRLDPAGVTPASLLALQRTVGNGAVARMMAGGPVTTGALPGRRAGMGDEVSSAGRVRAGRRGAATTADRIPLQRTIGDGHDLDGSRFKGNVVLEAVYDNEYRLRAGEAGLHVTIVQQALADLGYGVDVVGRYLPDTVEAVASFQDAASLTVTGEVDGATIEALDEDFAGHAPERDIATDPDRSLYEGTRVLGPDDREALRAALTTEPRTAGGEPPVFRRTIAQDVPPYEERVHDALDAEITWAHRDVVEPLPPREPANLMGGDEIDHVAASAKRATDAVFGRYATGPALAFGVNILDRYEAGHDALAASPAAAAGAVQWRVDKLLATGNLVSQIDHEHGAVQSRSEERALLGPVRERVMRDRWDDLVRIHLNWPGAAEGGRIVLQRHRGPTAAANRDVRYTMFATVIHEYLHTLEHPEHRAYHSALPEQRGGVALREGMTDYFAKMVWDGLTFDADLRAEIEGRFRDPHDPTGHPIPMPDPYDEWENAGRAVGVIGIRNAMAAYFGGRTDLVRLP
ncbi:peptidoglycan-binding domain-containing protein [Actinosynnema sp. CS-041913]|uniref:peptidoglycan-binding domain-containing protein n=1 Tax=Actinosynnema sp. CS-041913 TaxID=3239917 RepID=UPI003D91FBF4